MIYLHALVAPHDIIPLGVSQGALMYHVVSDIPGPNGTRELLSTMRKCGAHDYWLQDAGSYREHFDVFDPWTDAVRRQGAQEISNRALGVILSRKQQYQHRHIAIPAITSRQMRIVEVSAADHGILPSLLLPVAARRISEWIVQRGFIPNSSRIAIVAGTGKTGIIGIEAAMMLAQMGYAVQLFTMRARNTLTDIFDRLYEELRIHQIEMQQIVPEFTENLSEILYALRECDLLVDAVWGYGLQGAPAREYASLIKVMNNSDRPILAIDLPSGLDANEAGIAGACIRAAATLTWTLPKRAMMMTAHAPYLGELWLADIGIPRRLLKIVSARVGAAVPQAHIQRLISIPFVEDDENFAPHACRLAVSGNEY